MENLEKYRNLIDKVDKKLLIALLKDTLMSKKLAKLKKQIIYQFMYQNAKKHFWKN